MPVSLSWLLGGIPVEGLDNLVFTFASAHGPLRMVCVSKACLMSLLFGFSLAMILAAATIGLAKNIEQGRTCSIILHKDDIVTPSKNFRTTRTHLTRRISKQSNSDLLFLCPGELERRQTTHNCSQIETDTLTDCWANPRTTPDKSRLHWTRHQEGVFQKSKYHPNFLKQRTKGDHRQRDYPTT